MPSAVQVFRESFSLVKSNYVKFIELYIVIFLIFFVVILFGSLLAAALSLSSASSTGSGIGLGTFLYLIILLVIIFLLEPIWIGSYYSMALQSLKGSVSVTYAISQAVKKYVPLLWTIFLESLIFIAIDAIIFSPLLFALPGFLTALTSHASASGASLIASIGSFIGLAIVLVLVYLVAMALLSPLFFEAVPLVMIEGTRGINALRESIDIGETRFWTLLGIIVLMVVVSFAIGFVEGIIVGVVEALAGALAYLAVYIILSLLVGAFIGAWVNTLPVVFYRDFLGKKA